MSKPPHQLFGGCIDWSNVDLLDACCDPMLDSMGLDSPPYLHTAVDPIAQQPAWEPPLASPVVHLSFPPGSTQVAPGHIVANGSQLQCYSYGSMAPEDLEQTVVIVPKSIDDEQAFIKNPFNSAELENDVNLSNTTDEGSILILEKESKFYVYKDLTCSDCNASFTDYFQMDYHDKLYGHRAYKCRITGCEQRHGKYGEFLNHASTAHIEGHGRITTAAPNECAQCGASFQDSTNLRRHGMMSQHQPYACKCGDFFSRLDVLNRHLESFDTAEPGFPCRYCKRHRGANGFRRKDHLTQHIRNYHHLDMDNENGVNSKSKSKSRLNYSFPVCSHPECPRYRSETFQKLPRSEQEKNKPFNSQSAFTKHMREEHDECAFPCDIPGCTRIGRRGYFREKALMKHRKEQHLGASEYQPKKRQEYRKCMEPNCLMPVDPLQWSDHYNFHHRSTFIF